MTGLCGWFRPGHAEQTPIGARAGTIPAPTGATESMRNTDGGACLVRGGWMAADEQGRIAAIAGHPHWRHHELQQLADGQGHAHALLQAWLHHGENLFTLLSGDFVLAVIDPAANRLIAGIDRIGQHTLHFARVPGGIVFGSSADSVLAHPGITRALTPTGIYHYFYYHMVPAPVSLYAGIEKLQGSHYLSAADDKVQVAQYWRPAFREPAQSDIVALGRSMRTLLDESVRRLLGDDVATGAFLSGGLDSSTVAGVMARQRPAGETDTFSIGFDAEGYDEMAYARIAAQHFSTHTHEYYVTPQDVVSAVPLIAASYDEPFGNSSALPAYFCARMASESGMARLLAGDGGDELFAGNERYVKQGVFEHWTRLPGALRGMLAPLIRALPAALPRAGSAKSYIAQADTPLPDRLQSYNFLHRIPVAEIFSGDFLAQTDAGAPLALMREIYRRPDEASDLNRMMYLDWQQTLADNDLRKVSRMCWLADIDVVFPMLDDALIEFSCNIPSSMKIAGGRLRHFYKEATADFLPREIIDKKKHGFGLPFGVWMRTYRPLQELAYDSLLQLKRQPYLNAAFIDRLIDLHRGGHAAYYGEMIWLLMMFELWLQAHS